MHTFTANCGSKQVMDKGTLMNHPNTKDTKKSEERMMNTKARRHEEVKEGTGMAMTDRIRREE
ncbi:MAG: hypothetical protein WD042_10145 [Phycisphaeraceae bacterium]